MRWKRKATDGFGNAQMGKTEYTGIAYRKAIYFKKIRI